VLVQTFSPEHPSIALAAKHDYLTFAAGELHHRGEHNYPPYQRLARIVVRGKKQEEAEQYAERLAAAFEQALEQLRKTEPGELRLLGPAEAPVFRLKGYHRYHFQLQSPSSAFLHRVLRQALPSVRALQGVEVTVDIDPQDML
jgi:primosomal protein N' (replication factor Y) (superfamily II helicase)